MKKLLVLLLVLGMASVAGAALQISVNGNMEPEDSTIYLWPSQEIELDIYSTVDLASGDPGENEYWVLVAPTSCATISGGAPALAHDDYSFDGPYQAQGNVGGVPEGEDGIAALQVTFGVVFPAMTPIWDSIIFHCEIDNGPTTVTLWNAGTTGQISGDPWDQVTIHQVPEPMTVALLGLGGLFLLRRRK